MFYFLFSSFKKSVSQRKEKCGSLCQPLFVWGGGDGGVTETEKQTAIYLY